MFSPLIDTNSLIAIESHFSAGRGDPWARLLAGHLADAVVYADAVRYTCGVATASREAERLPEIVSLLDGEGESILRPEPVVVGITPRLATGLVEETFENFAAWVLNNQASWLRWLRTHSSPAVRRMQELQVGRPLFFALDDLPPSDLTRLSSRTGASVEDLLYAFDNVLRGPLYAVLADGQPYIHHPTREPTILPTARSENGATRRVAVPFADSVRDLLDRLTLGEYCQLLLSLRKEVRRRNIHKLPPGHVDREVLREIAAAASLAPKLRFLGRVVGFLAGIASGVAVAPALGPAGAIAGGVISIASSIWSGNLPRSAARIQWVRWAIEWNVEAGAETRG